MSFTRWLRSLKQVVRPVRRRQDASRLSRRWPRTLLTLEILEDRALMSTLMVTNTNDVGAGSLRQAILDANAGSSNAAVAFDLSAADPNHYYYKNDGLAGQVTSSNRAATAATDDTTIADIDPDWAHSWWTVTPTSALPRITAAVTIDGYTQQAGAQGAQANTLSQGDNAILRVELNGNGLGTTGLLLYCDNSTIRGLTINNFYADAIDLEGITGGNGAPDTPHTDNTIAGNFIGTDVSGSVAESNASRGNVAPGINLNIVSRTTIGGTSPADRNLISGNSGRGIVLGNDSPSNVVEGNYIGTNASGTTALGNAGSGIDLNGGYYGSLNNIIGGTSAGAGNLISGNGSSGIAVEGNVLGTVIQGNYVGVNVTGGAALGNNGDGMGVNSAYKGASAASGILIGGTVPGAGNVISGNRSNGVNIVVGDGADVIQGNVIGTNAAGTAAVSNGAAGLAVSNLSQAETIGGAAAGAGNLISGNHGNGVSIFNSTSSNVVQGNRIGTDITGVAPLGNGADGIFISNATGNNAIGGTLPGAGNIIAFNGSSAANSGLGMPIGNGVQDFADGAGNAILGNSIYANQLLGIDLNGKATSAGDGVTPDDTGDADTGPNNLQNYPVLASSSYTSSQTTVVGTLNSTPSTMFRLECFANATADPSGHGEGQTYLGATSVTTDVTGNVSFAVILPVSLPTGQTIISATATDPAGNTSEFSADIAAAPGRASTTTAVSSSLNPSAVGQPVTFTATVTAGSGAFDNGGAVQFTIDGSTYGSPVALSGGQATIDDSALSSSGSPHAITAAFSGDAGFGGSSGSLAGGQTVNRVSTTTAVSSSPNPSAFGQPVTLTATVSNTADGATPTGRVEFFDDSTDLGPGTGLSGSGSSATSIFTTSSLAVGSHTIQAIYTPTGPFEDSSGSVTQTVNAGVADLAVSVRHLDVATLREAPATALTGQDYYYLVTVTNNGPQDADGVVLRGAIAAGETVTRIDTPGVLDGSPPLILDDFRFRVGVGGSVTLAVTAHADTPGVYTDTFTATSPEQLPDPPHNTATATETVIAATGTSVSAVSNPSTYGLQVVFTAAVANSGAGGTPTGTVQFTVDGHNYGSPVVVDASGQASTTDSALSAGSHTIQAVYGGASNFAASTSDAYPQTVSKATPVITWTNPADITYGTALSDTQLNATASAVVNGATVTVAGTFTYMPPVGTALNAGNGQTLSEHFVPSDGTDFSTPADTTVAINVSSRTVPAPATLSGIVWADFNDDGQVDFGEKAIASVPLGLDGTDDLGRTVHLTQSTDANGVYLFEDLRPGTYAITETQPAGYTQGINSVGTINATVVGEVSGDAFTAIALLAGQNGINYNFGEQPAASGNLSSGQTATIGFWQNKNGQNLIKTLNGGATSAQLGNWLAATFPNMYGASAGADNLTGKTNSQVAAFYSTLFLRTAQTAPGGPPKMDAQILATAFAVYVTDQALAGTTATAYGFRTSSNGVGTQAFNVGSNGAAFAVANSSSLTVLDLLLAVNSSSSNGLLFDTDSNGLLSPLETSYRTAANNVFTAINEAGHI